MTADYAKNNGFSVFSTTLLISPHQQHEVLRQIGTLIEREKDIPFVYQDLRKSYSDSRKLTKPMELYRQQYCGCLYSEYERQLEIKARKETHQD
jgi:predicted adenine nucleotide alpha hydrolase (AANH) superfamily ATPase